ncbi:DCC1-like thiol-disulfide oxidoreductase family protein [Aquimarina spongiae]|uniref:Predicted thiol-disulfide oxidoreductase YuxK, DCC family n=1 Tax=Aquimarina spongiae TaxID=570521 RepID=A0A1M6E4U3_9FLAO|nr:DCC1-like thiol-disulfide oxidoreductase family protein [Aquimarina spongiae]SHI80526.1 Predicted thiol-disulfide oxidoreductase YuxK, DCC family [Aquimarina spongiae]
MKKLLKTLQRHWFTPMKPQHLALLRITTGLFCLWYLCSRFDMLQRVVQNTEAFEPIGILNWMTQPIAPEVFWWVSIILIILNVLYIIGWKFKYIGPSFAILALLFFTYRNSWSMIYHNRNALILHIIILGFVASADAWSWDSWKKSKKNILSPKISWHYGWPVQLICTVTVGSYLLSGIAKLAGDLSWEWVTGSAMRSQVSVDAIRKEMLGSESAPLFDFLFEHTWLFLAMGILTFILELGAPLALFRKKWGMAWAVLTWMMHWGIFCIMGITFRYQMSGFIFLSFFDIEKLWNPSKKKPSTVYTTYDINETPSKPIVLFDGVCNLCNGWIRFILKRERNPLFQFASLQSPKGQELLGAHRYENSLSSIILIENNKIYQKSDAVLKICSYFKFPWNISNYLRFVPKRIRDFSYDFIAARRYKWFGKQEHCGLMTKDQKVRFLDL